MKIMTIAAALLILAAAVRTRAAEAQGAQAAAEPCASDIQQFCKDATPGSGRITLCLKNHLAQLSAECRASGMEPKNKEESFLVICSTDLAAFCSGTKGGDGEELRCLKAHEKELSGGCGEKFAKTWAEMIKRSPCYNDTEKYCGNVKPGEDRIENCLVKHEKELSAVCETSRKKHKADVEKSPCGAETQKFCKNVRSGEGRLTQCLDKHYTDLSETCKKRLVLMKARFSGNPGKN